MQVMKRAACVAALCALVACTQTTTTRQYVGPQVTRIIVDKGERRMFLMHHKRVLRAFDIGLGFAPEGDKIARGDGRTPEGNYFINRRNPNSQFHLSMGINYPNAQDVRESRSAGVHPGGDIFIHGRPSKYQNGIEDWTAGCIAVTDQEIELIYAMVRNGTPITILP